MDDWKNLLRGIAPTLATALGGPLAGAAASFIAGKLGVPEATVDSVTKAISGNTLTPEQLVALKSADLEFQRFLENNKIKLEEIASADRQGAREMLKVTNSKVPAWLTFIITVGFFGVLGLMFFRPEVKESAPLMIMLGALGAAWTSCCNFWLGTTSQSAQKTNLLANSTPAK